MMFVAVIDKKIVATTGADLNHLVWNIFKNVFIIFYTVTDEPTWNAAGTKINVGVFERTNTFKAVGL